MSNNIYDHARICGNGHLINDACSHSPEFTSDYCTRCGALGIEDCPQCKTSILGALLSTSEYSNSWSISQNLKALPSYCRSCGHPFPWTVAKIDAAKALISEMEELTEDDKESLKSTLGDLVCDTPKSTLAAERYKKIVRNLAVGAGDGLKKIVMEIVTEGVKKLVYPS